MVTNVETNGLLDGPFTKLMKQIYITASSRKLNPELHIPLELSSYMRTVYRAFNLPLTIYDTKFDFGHYELDAHDPRCVCAFSGGKDSLANILMLRKLGYEPIAFFVKGINYQYPHEYKIAKELSAKIGIPFVERAFSLRGRNEFPENPVKDQFILAMMLDYGLKRGIPNYSFGVYVEKPSAHTNKEYMLSDSSDMFDTFQEFVNYFYPEVDIPYYLLGEIESVKVIIETDKDLLNDVCSCMSPVRFKQGYIQNAEKKYDIKLLPNRCPSCYKCCLEAIQLNAFGITQYPDSYIEHCKDVVIKWNLKHHTRKELEDGYLLMDGFEWVPEEWLRKEGT